MNTNPQSDTVVAEKSEGQVLEHLPLVVENSGELSVATVEQKPLAVQQNPVGTLTAEQVELIKNTCAKGVTNEELSLFLYTAKRTGLDPLVRQIHAVKRWDKRLGREVMSIQTGIDGYRLIAERTGRYEGQDGPYYCGEDGVWHDVWLAKTPPTAAKVGVFKAGFRQALYATARFAAYAQSGKDGLNPMWAKMGDIMIAKCAEAQALRKAFPLEMAGIYTSEEMGQAEQHYAPQERRQEQPRSEQQPAAGITEAQLKTLNTRFKNCMLGIVPMLRKRFNAESFEVLTKSQASQILDKLDAAVAAAKAAMPKPEEPPAEQEQYVPPAETKAPIGADEIEDYGNGDAGWEPEPDPREGNSPF